MNRGLSESLRQNTEELEVLAENHRLSEMILSKQNAINFSRSQLVEVQRENDDFRSRIHRLEQEGAAGLE